MKPKWPIIFVCTTNLSNVFGIGIILYSVVSFKQPLCLASFWALRGILVVFILNVAAVIYGIKVKQWKLFIVLNTASVFLLQALYLVYFFFQLAGYVWVIGLFGRLCGICQGWDRG